MIRIKLKDNNTVKILFDESDNDMRHLISNHFSPFVDGYWFMPRYKMGIWTGKIPFYNEMRSELPIMLVSEMCQIIGPHREVKIEREVVNVLIPNDNGFKYRASLPNWEHVLHDYQADAIEQALRFKRGVVQIATGGGKAATIIAAVKGAEELGYGRRYLIIVPRKQLVEQFYEEFDEVGWHPAGGVGRLYGDNKSGLDAGQDVIIATWQTLGSLRKGQKHKYLLFINSFDGVFVDEVHTAKAHVLSDVLKDMACNVKLGFTATVPKNDVDRFNIISGLGPTIWKTGTKELQDKGHLSPIYIRRINLCWDVRDNESFQKEKKWLEANEKRNRLLAKIAVMDANKNRNILILVERIKHGQAIREEISKYNEKECSARVDFINGSMSVANREAIRKRMEKDGNNIVIATYGTFAMGINIKALHSILFASPGKSEIRTIQSIGRGLRKSNRKKRLDLYDISDNTKYATRHSKKREQIYIQEKYRYQSFNVTA